MSDDKYLIPPPPKPDPTQLPTHPQDTRRATIAIIIAGVAAVFTGLALILTGLQAREAHQARIETKAASDAQAKDVERSRKAAEESSKAANRSADAASASVGQLSKLVQTNQRQLQSNEKMFSIEHSPLISPVGNPYDWFVVTPPRMEQSKATELKVQFSNGGKPAFGCKVSTGGKYSKFRPLDDPGQVTFPAVLDLGPGGSIGFSVLIPPPVSIEASSGDARLYLYGQIDCANMPTPSKPYHSEWCEFLPVAANGDIQNFVHGCSEGDTSKIPHK